MYEFREAPIFDTYWSTPISVFTIVHFCVSIYSSQLGACVYVSYLSAEIAHVSF